MSLIMHSATIRLRDASGLHSLFTAGSGIYVQFRSLMIRLLIATGFVAFSCSAHSAITLFGPAVVNAKDTVGINIANGSLGLLIADTAGDGIIGLSTGTSGALTAVNNPGITEGTAGLSVGNTFGGDLVIARLASGSGGSFIFSGNSLSLTPLMFLRRFAIVWFDQMSSGTSLMNAPEGSSFGVVHGRDWLLPPGDSGAYQFNPTDSSGLGSYYLTDLTINSPAAIRFRTTNGSGTSAASFTVVPEPSSTLVVGLGVILPLVMGRRRALK